MAIWRLYITGLQVLCTDNDGWPVTQVVNLTTDIQENNIIRLYRTAPRRAKEQLPDLCDLVVNRIERIDKQTEKDYGYPEYDHIEPTYELNSDQIKFLQDLKNDILTKLLRDSELKSVVNSFMSFREKITFISEDMAYIRHYDTIVPHEEAMNIVSALEKFYSRITSTELEILTLEKIKLAHKEISLVGIYKSNRILDVNSLIEKRNVYIKSNSNTIGSLEVSEEKLKNFLQLNQETGFDLLSKLLNWAIQSEDAPQFIERIGNLDIEKLQKLNASIEISSLKNVLSVWENNKQNSEEEFWQSYLSENSFAFSQIFSIPIIVLKDKAYVGGKGIENIGGGILDYLYTNKITKNLVCIEIKNPQTKLLASEYRSGVYSISKEISGAIIQVANYRDSLTKEYYALVRKSKHDFEAFNPPCMVVAGNIEKELIDPDKRKSFELFRNGLKDIEIITFDELFTKVKMLIDLLEGNTLG
ncbi:Shedu immune nuclease family protein [Coleofasciculus sp. FACHB-129]|uniref:Shedu immune nuclease family protein n=1 Tax=Cyanophyceae TaxID=3028117 RepID=UPI0016886E88|nr:Shedu immune nuclease family protein [Coleofasciculus sp. FACHB-129]MBD1893899.1 DUF4263 domain-containing protein [Coleofasciculus sp. FACHB-129]